MRLLHITNIYKDHSFLMPCDVMMSELENYFVNQFDFCQLRVDSSA